MSYANYHKTLSAAVDAAIVHLTLSGAILADNNIAERYQYDGVKYGETKTADSAIDTLKGKKTKKYAHVSIYRMETGTYELTVYIL